MTTSTPILAPGPAAALTAVLRDVGPRAVVLAELLCGSPAAADRAATAAARALGAELAHGPVVDWTHRFWSLLLRAIPARPADGASAGPPALAPVARLGTGSRAVLLLRLVARLDEAPAAAALGLPLDTYRRALRLALPRRVDGTVDLAAWQQLKQACERCVRAGPDPRSGRLDRLFALAADTGQVALRPRRSPRMPRRPMPALLWLALGACVLGFAATFVLPHPQRLPADAVIHATALPAVSDPAATFDAQTAVLTHPDFDRLAAPADAALADQLDFLAWYADQLARAAGTGAPLLFPDAAAPAGPAPGGAGHGAG